MSNVLLKVKYLLLLQWFESIVVTSFAPSGDYNCLLDVFFEGIVVIEPFQGLEGDCMSDYLFLLKSEVVTC